VDVDAGRTRQMLCLTARCPFPVDVFPPGSVRRNEVEKQRVHGRRIQAGYTDPQNGEHTSVQTTVCGEIKIPLNKYYYFRYSSMLFYKIFRDRSRHNLPLLLQILLSHLWLFRSSIVLNIQDDFSTSQTNTPAYNQLSGIYILNI